MNWVFMNSLQKRLDEDRVVTAQVTIGEDAGVWHVYWNEPGEDGREQEVCWFEGNGWDEMLRAFRGNLLQKMAEGYAPLLDNITSDVQSITGRSEWMQKLYYYSDLHKNEEVYETLREWRRKQASKEGKAPYMIATNRLLALLSAFLPRTEQELAQLPGFGPYKIRQYGKELLAITGAAEREAGFPLDWVAERIDYAQYKLWLHQQQEAFLEREKLKKAQRAALLEAAEQGASLDSLQQSVQLSRRDAILMLEDLEKEGVDISKLVAAELSAVPAAERQRAAELFAKSQHQYLKPILAKLHEENIWKDVPQEKAYEWLRLLRLQARMQRSAPSEAKAAG
jgi:ribonuclease D